MKKLAATLLSTLALTGALAVTGTAAQADPVGPPHSSSLVTPDYRGGGYGWECNPVCRPR